MTEGERVLRNQLSAKEGHYLKCILPTFRIFHKLSHLSALHSHYLYCEFSIILLRLSPNRIYYSIIYFFSLIFTSPFLPAPNPFLGMPRHAITYKPAVENKFNFLWSYNSKYFFWWLRSFRKVLVVLSFPLFFVAPGFKKCLLVREIINSQHIGGIYTIPPRSCCSLLSNG